jgi:integrase
MGSSAGIYEYPKNSGIKISLVPNESIDSRNADREASQSYRVTIPARLSSGKRKMKQFRSEKEAKVFAKEEWDNFRVLGEDFSDLTKDERKEAINAWKMAKKSGVRLMDIVEFGIKRMCPEGGIKKVHEVVNEFVQIKERRQAKGDLKERSLRDVRARAEMLTTLLGDSNINEISGRDLKNSLLGIGRRSRTLRNYRSIWSEVFKFAKQRRYILDNPFDDLSKEDVKEIIGSGDDWNPPGILEIKEVELLLSTALAKPELQLLPAIILGLFCGVRTEEIKQLKWGNIKLDDSDPHVVIPREIAKKRRMRHVHISPNAVEWLLQCKDRTGAITANRFENDYQRRFRALLIKCGFIEKVKGAYKSHWKINAMRHSFGTYHFALHGDSIKTSLEMGHKTNDDVLFEHYRSLATKADAKAYFDLRPDSNLGKELKIA